jgi:hypothetical protein
MRNTGARTSPPLWPALQTALRVPPVALPPIGVGVVPPPSPPVASEPDPPPPPQLIVKAAKQINPIRRPIFFKNLTIISRWLPGLNRHRNYQAGH